MLDKKGFGTVLLTEGCFIILEAYMRARSMFIIVLVIIVLGLIWGYGFNQITTNLPVADQVDSSHTSNASRAIHPADKYFYLSHWQWTTDEWTGNDKPFAELRSALDAKIKAGTSAMTLVAQSKHDATLHPTDALDQYRYAYAVYLATKNPLMTPDEVLALSGDVNNNLAVALSPHCYNYDRLRLMLLAKFPNPHLLPIAARVYAKDPKDLDNAYFYISQLCSGDMDSLRKAQTLAVALCVQYPSRPTVYGLLAGVDRTIYVQTRSKSDAQLAIDQYVKYLQYAPKNAGWRSAAELNIQWLKQSAEIP